MRLDIAAAPPLPTFLQGRVRAAVEAALASSGLTLPDYWRALQAARPAAAARAGLDAAEQAALQVLDAAGAGEFDVRISIVGAAPAAAARRRRAAR